MKSATNTVGAPWLHLVLALSLLIPTLSAAPSAAPQSPPASPSPAAAPDPNTYRLISVRPDDEIRTRGRVQVRTRAIRLKFERKTTIQALRGAITFIPEVKIDWYGSDQIDDDEIRLEGKFEREVNYELRVVGHAYANDGSSYSVQRGTFPFTLPAATPAVEFANLSGVLERQSKQLVHLKMRDVEKIKLSTTEVPLAALLAAPKLVDDPAPDPVPEVRRRRRGHAPHPPKADAVPVLDTAAWNARARELEAALKGSDFAPLASPPVKTESDLFPEPGPADKERRASLPLTWRESKARGATYILTAEAVEPASKPTSRLVQVTDLALSTKTSPTELTAWVTRLSTGEPVSGAAVFLASGTTRVWFAGRTDADGVLRVRDHATASSILLSASTPKPEPFELSLGLVERVVAVQGDDAIWDLTPDDAAVTTPGHITTGADDKPRAHVFTERGVYRPGDTVNFKVTARSPAGPVTAVPKAGTQVQVLIENPRGQIAREFTLPLSPFGTAAGSFALKGHEPLGQWSVEVRTPSDKKVSTTEDPSDDEDDAETRRVKRRERRNELGALLGETTFRMEEYVPPRHKVEVSFQQKTSADQPTVTGVIAGVYYAGGPVKHGKVRWRVALTGTRAAVPGAPGYTAGVDQAEETELLDAGEATLDAAGQLGIDVPLSGELADGRRAIAITATVLDFDSRAATGEGAWSTPPKYVVGISDEPRQIRDREPVDLTAVVVDRATGKRVETGTLKVAVLRRAHTHVAKRNEDGDFYDAPQHVMVRAFEWTVNLKDGIAPVHLEPSGAGQYALEIGYTAPDGTTFHSSRNFKMDWSYDYEGDYCYEGSDHMGPRWYAERMHALAVTSDRGEYAPGDTARFYVRAPRQPVAVLVAVEREEGLTVQRVKLGPDGQFDLKIPDGWSPNVYVSVLASYAREGYPVYPTDADTLAPSYGHGYLSVPIRREASKLTIGLKGAGEGVTALPGAKHTVVVTVTDAAGKPVEAEVALAAVDESVLSLTGYATPSLDQLFAVGVPLGVKTHDTRRGVSLQTPYRALTVRPLTGGDGGDGKQSKTRENFDPVACWRPQLVTDASGQATAEFTLPDAMTAYRVFAVAIDRGERHGNIARTLVVKKPFYLEAGLPRFFTAGDKAKVFIALFNHTGQEATATLKATVQGGLKFTVPDAPVTIAASDRVQIPVEVEATEAVHARIELEARLGGLVDRVVLPIPVRERYTMRTWALSGLVGDSTQAVKMALPDSVLKLPEAAARTGKVELQLSPLPTLRMAGGLKYLLEYPHGCIEQTSSKTLPLVAMRNLAAKGLVPTLTPEMTDPFIKGGVARLLSMQTESGGFGYWPGDKTPHVWGSAYATMTLTLAKQGGAEVPADALARATKYLGEIVNEKAADTAYTLPYAHYVLALAGAPAGEPHKLADLAGRFSIEDRLFMWMAAARAGLKTEAKAGLEKILAELKGKDLKGWHPYSFYTGGRANAVALLACAEIAPDIQGAGDLATSLFRTMGPAGYWYNNHETAWTLVALTRMTEAAPPTGGVACAYKLPTTAVAKVSLAATKTETIQADPLAFLKNPEAQVTREGPGTLVWRVAATYPYEGVEQTTGALIKRTYRRLAGDGPIRVGDLVEVVLDLEVPRHYDYAALTDPLPAGLVAVNSALKNEAQPIKTENDWGSYEFGDYVSTWQPAYLEIRDDRVVSYRNYGWHGRYRFTYVARAVCEGSFLVPPAKIEPMYQPEDSWFSRSGSLTILPSSK